MTNIIDKVRTLYDKFQTVSPERLCRYLGINLFYADLPESTDGIFYTVENEQIILVNQNLPSPNFPYVIAHELGHALLHPEYNYMFMAGQTFMKTERYEIEADYFAATLLMWELIKNNDLSAFTADQLAHSTGLRVECVENWMSHTRHDQIC